MQEISPGIERRLKHLEKRQKLVDGVQTCIELADEQAWTGKRGTSFEGGPENAAIAFKTDQQENKKMK